MDLEIDRRTLPNRSDFKSKGYESRQVIDFTIECFVREYRAEILEDSDGHCYTAEFPDNVTKAIQYGSSIKSLSVYLSQYQLIPFLNADETGIQIGERNHWLHVLSTPKTTYFFPHEKRGKEAMKRFLAKANEKVIANGGILPEKDQRKLIKRYRLILEDGKRECPIIVKAKGRRGRAKQTKERNLLDRLIDHEDSVLRFMKIKNVPFTNNRAENDIRMVKVHQKVFRMFPLDERRQVLLPYKRLSSYS